MGSGCRRKLFLRTEDKKENGTCKIKVLFSKKLKEFILLKVVLKSDFKC